MLDSQSGGYRFESRPGILHTTVYSAFHPSRVGKWVPSVPRKAHSDIWLTPTADERVGMQVKLWDPSRTRAIPERFCACGDVSLWRGAISIVCTFTFQVYVPLPYQAFQPWSFDDWTTILFAGINDNWPAYNRLHWRDCAGNLRSPDFWDSVHWEGNRSEYVTCAHIFFRKQAMTIKSTRLVVKNSTCITIH